MPSRFTLPHIDIASFSTSQAYKGVPSTIRRPERDRAVHGNRVQNELVAALIAAEQLRVTDERLPPPSGKFIEVELRAGTKPDVLDQTSKGIRSGAAKTDQNNVISVALFVQDESEPLIKKMVHDYLNGQLSAKGNPPQKSKVEAIESIRAARLEDLWTDDPRSLPTDQQHQMWWALWCWNGSEATIDNVCDRLQIRAADTDHRLYFPEIVVIPVYTTRAILELILFTTGAIAEVRRASDSPHFYLNEIEGKEADWVADLAERTIWPSSDAPAVCLFDTGVNRGHALIEPALAPIDMQALNNDWGVDDHDVGGHGTAMAGLALHGDLTAAISDTSRRRLSHRLESVKFLPPRGFSPAQPQNYGALTQGAIALPEITSPDRIRVYCMAITNDEVSGSIPSAWSAAVDQAANGSMTGDVEETQRRLIIISGGNVAKSPDMVRNCHQDDHPIEDPAQAWNALTVGGFTDLNAIHEHSYQDWNALAAVGDLSPHSRTSVTWPQNAPLKPEIVMEAGNCAVNVARTEVITLDSLTLLTSGNTASMSLTTMDGTSAASALAARLAARLFADHPEYWPETIRALMVHSAEWTPHMLALQNANNRRGRRTLVRRFGYGVPDYERATASAISHLALISQTELQPFRMEGGRTFGECHYYDLPIPRRMLEDLANEVVELKITLSYFIDPNPGLSANTDPQRYQSHGLRFDLKRKNESLEVFKKRVNADERDNPRVGPQRNDDDGRWLLGPKNVSAGSLHCDVWTGPAIELVGRDTLCIKPVVGWSRNRSDRMVCDKKRRYSLVITVKSRNSEIDLYTPIKALISLETRVQVEIPNQV